MSDAVLAYLFLALLADILAWVLLFRAISRRLRDRHFAGKGGGVLGGPGRRKNAMDQFFSVLDFLRLGGHAALGDRTLARQAILLKMATASFFLIFLAMMFGPFFLRLK